MELLFQYVGVFFLQFYSKCDAAVYCILHTCSVLHASCAQVGKKTHGFFHDRVKWITGMYRTDHNSL